MAHTPDERNTHADAALAQVPATIAALIQLAPTRNSLAVCLSAMGQAQAREEIRREAGRFIGLLAGTWVAMSPDDSRKWAADDYQVLVDYGHLAESTALARLEE